MFARLSVSAVAPVVLYWVSVKREKRYRKMIVLPIFMLGAGMNAAFATGRLCDLQTGRMRLLNHKNSDLMVRN